VAYSFKDYLRDRGEFVDDEEVFGRQPLTERVFREFKLGVFTMFVITMLLVTLFWDERRPELEPGRIQNPEIRPVDEPSFLEQLVRFITGRGEPEAPRTAASDPAEQPAPHVPTNIQQPAPVAPPSAVEFRRYTVQRGDTLYSIARRVYRDGTKWRSILEANPDLGGSAERLGAGMTILIPVRRQ
jgi:hypothetical protein